MINQSALNAYNKGGSYLYNPYEDCLTTYLDLKNTSKNIVTENWDGDLFFPHSYGKDKVRHCLSKDSMRIISSFLPLTMTKAANPKFNSLMDYLPPYSIEIVTAATCYLLYNKQKLETNNNCFSNISSNKFRFISTIVSILEKSSSVTFQDPVIMFVFLLCDCAILSGSNIWGYHKEKTNDGIHIENFIEEFNNLIDKIPLSIRKEIICV